FRRWHLGRRVTHPDESHVLVYLTSNAPTFFFNLYADHRDLHSFPTRRSSDLPTAAKRGARCCSATTRRESRISCSTRRTRDPRLDRKSTRLNSSHDQISYAVFCLKNKNHGVVTTSSELANDRGECVGSGVDDG